jgi:ribosome-binding ATPase YchF (GTP1/OBG family)
VRDIEVITRNWCCADLATVQKRKDKNTKAARGGDKQAKAELDLIVKLEPHLDSGKPAIMLDVTNPTRKRC